MKDNLKINRFCDFYKISIEQFLGKQTIYKNLYINENVPYGFNPIVYGNLCMRGINTLPENFSPIIRGHLWLNSVIELPVGFRVIVGGDLDLSSLESLPTNTELSTIGNLYLDSLKDIPKDLNIIVKSNLIISSLIFSNIPTKIIDSVKGTIFSKHRIFYK